MKKKILIPIIIVATCAIGAGGYSIKKMNEPEPQIVAPITTASVTPAPKATPVKVVPTTTPKKVEETKNSTSTPKTEVKEIKHETTKSVEAKYETTHHVEKPVVKHVEKPVVKHVEKSEPKKEVTEHHSETHNSNEHINKEAKHMEKSTAKKEVVEHHSESNNQANHEKKKEVNSKPIHHSGEYVAGIGTPADATRIVKRYFSTSAKNYIFLKPIKMNDGRYYVPVKRPGEADINAMGYVVNPINSEEPRVQEVG